jgi:NAD(P)-dependent dehydrogenase (short-subunit alcohol dehydrogenase family)
VSLSSSAHRRSDFNRDDPNYERRPYDRRESYGQSKTCSALFVVGLTRSFSDEGIFSNAVMPGGILTNPQRHMSIEDQRQAGFIDEGANPNPLFKCPAQGASTSVWAALAPELEAVGGLYLENCAQAGLMDHAQPFMGYMPYALDPGSADVLWQLSEERTRA